LKARFNQTKDLFHLLTSRKGLALGIIMDHAVCEDNYEKIKTISKEADKVYIETFYLIPKLP
jgi:ribonuclease Z